MFEEHWQNTVALVQDNPVLGLGVAVIVAVLFYFRTKEMFKLLGFGLFLVAAFYIITLLVGTVDSSTKQKDQMVHKTRQAIGDE